MTAETPPPPANTGLIIPVVIWGPSPPSSKITTIKFLSNRSTIITGSDNGHLIIWKCTEDSLSPLLLMIGHSSSISVVSATTCSSNSTRFISASVDGSLCLWDIQDGRCVDTISSNNIHRKMEPYMYRSSRHSRQTKIFCIGDYADFIVMDPQDLTIVYNLSSRVEPEWIQSYSIISRTNKVDQCIGLTSAGMVKVWSLTDLEKKDMANPLYEDESRRLELRNVKAVSFCPLNERLFLIVAAGSWHILDLDDLSFVFSMKCAVPAISGQIVDVDKVSIGYNDQSLRIYQLPLSRLKGAQVSTKFGPSPSSYFNHEEPFEVATLEGQKGTISWINDAIFAFSLRSGVEDQFQALRASRDGRLLLWRIPSFDGDFMKTVSLPQLPLKYKGTFEQSLQSVWNSLNENKDDTIPVLDPSTVTCSLLVASKGKLILGRRDGLITMAYACEALSRQLLDVSKEPTVIRKLYGHTAPVRCLFYPHEHHSRFESNVLLSGSDDFTVIAWNIQNGNKMFKFTNHGGPILRFLVPPANCSKQMSKCVCVVAQDHSVSLLNIREMKCCLLASRHPFPVKEVRWRPLDDFMLVRLDNGSVYVWQMETANIDRIVTGLMAEEVLNACDEQIGREEGTDEVAASSAVQLMRALKNKNIDAAKQSVKSGDAEKIHLEPMTLDVGAPFMVNALPGCSQGAHIVQFEVSALISGLINVDYQGDNLDEENSPNGFTKRIEWQNEAGLYVDIARLMLSLLHAWNLDKDLDSVCIKKLGMNKPKHQLYFGNVSRHGQLTVVLPQSTPRSFESFSLDVRWQASHSLTTTHLLAMIATANTLMNMRNIISSHAIRRKSTAPVADVPKHHPKDVVTHDKQQMKQCWSLLAALHCVLLPDLVRPKSTYAAPRIELLARRWQDSSMEIRTAAQALLIRELSRLDTLGRRRLIESWAPFLPPLLDPELSIFGARLQSSVPSLPPSAPPIPPRSKHSPPPMAPVPEALSSGDGESGVQQVRRNQATAIILLGVVGAEFGDELNRADLTRATALSLLELLVAAPSSLLPVNSSLRRAAIDLLGKGFVHWEPHLEISKVLLGLLDLAANAEKHLHPSVVVPGAPLSPLADACRTARSALALIAAARPPALLNALSMEVARYNSAAQHQTIQHTVVSPLLKSRAEVLRIIEELAEKKYNEVVERMLPVGEVLVHCLDTSLLKHKQLGEVFPPITKFNMVAYCPSSRRIAFGGYNGTCVVHELRAAKSHTLQSHHGPVTACSFSEDGKYLATYGASDAKVNFWQTTQSFLGMGQSSMKLVKSQPAPGSTTVNSPSGQTFRPKLVWINPKSITLMLPGGREQRFTL